MIVVKYIREDIEEAFDLKKELKCNLKGLYNYIKYGNGDFDGKHKDLELVYKIIFGAQAIQNNFDIKADKEEYIEALENLKEEYKEHLKEEIEILTKYFA